MAKKIAAPAVQAITQKTHTKEFLLKYHPFLKKQFRTLDKKELKSVEVFEELFPNSPSIDLYKLRAIYEYQK